MHRGDNMSSVQINVLSAALPEIIRNITTEIEKGVVSELQELVNKGILVIKVQQASIYRDLLTDGLKIGTRVFIEVKDQEYIAKLEKENAELKQSLQNINDAIKRL